ncbi:23S rRNA (guanosine(2251)-2'-O)-methyltransferase RlmB [uncultured Rubinisphaera sp.]|uniref:23S rRNA (guanosine(2251)-2'-O)-methyltransferase RlmB n=1 Tax=uncultured Rubinisphaera sp. TaxID=1678686 RepID=UPI0030D737C0|tara:strand:+ start:561 stop:1352 length:792 start_codon:yes stop_codon:yes gene_type:complete
MPRSRSNSAQPLLSNHQKSWLWGSLCVTETLEHGRWPIYELILAENANQPIHQQIEQAAISAKIPIERQSSKRLEQLCKSRDHQGVLALMGPFPYGNFEKLLTQISSKSRFVILDCIQDPFNFGAIVRSAAAFGMTGILIGKNSQVGVTSHVARSSVGMVNRIPICQFENLTPAIQELRSKNTAIFSAEQNGSLDIRQIFQVPEHCQQPLAIIMGNEAEGISSEMKSLCTNSVRIPMAAGVESLNAAVSAGILMYELSTLQNS